MKRKYDMLMEQYVQACKSRDEVGIILKHTKELYKRQSDYVEALEKEIDIEGRER